MDRGCGDSAEGSGSNARPLSPATRAALAKILPLLPDLLEPRISEEVLSPKRHPLLAESPGITLVFAPNYDQFRWWCEGRGINPKDVKYGRELRHIQGLDRLTTKVILVNDAPRDWTAYQRIKERFGDNVVLDSF